MLQTENFEAPAPTGCNLSADKLLKLLEIEHRYEQQDSDWRDRMGLLRQNVKALLDGELEPVNKNGTNQYTRGIGITKPTKNDVEYVKRRLKSQRPDLADKVAKGEIAANAAAVEAGFRSPGVKVRLDNMRSAARTLSSRLTREQLDELIAQLVDIRGE